MEGRIWDEFHLRWSRLEPPLRPDPAVCDTLQGLLQGSAARVLLLGATPELSTLAERTVAVDWSASVLRFIWPGDTSRRLAVQGTWLDLPFISGAFSAVVGDGSLNCLEYPSGYRRLFAEVARVTRPRSRVAIRVYLAPNPGEPVAAVTTRVLDGAVSSIHALKWLLAHALCADRGIPNIRVHEIVDLFDCEFPDRSVLERAAGWTRDHIDQIDAYSGSREVFSFPTATQVMHMLPDAFVCRFIQAGAYELANRCPILVMDARG